MASQSATTTARSLDEPDQPLNASSSSSDDALPRAVAAQLMSQPGFLSQVAKAITPLLLASSSQTAPAIAAALPPLELKTAPPNGSNIKVVLNVGGDRFVTTSATLTKEPSMLCSMFSGRFDTRPDVDGTYFIDRDSKHFARILNYLRNAEIDTDGLSRHALTELFKESVYYGVQSLIDKLTDLRRDLDVVRFLPDYHSPILTLSHGNRVLFLPQECPANKRWCQNALCSKPTPDSNGVYSFSVRLSRRVGCGVMIGYAPKHLSVTGANQYLYNGWFLSITELRSVAVQKERVARCGAQESKDKPVPDGTVITARYDSVARTVSFLIDCVDEPTIAVLKNVIDEDLHPAVLVGGSEELEIAIVDPPSASSLSSVSALASTSRSS